MLASVRENGGKLDQQVPFLEALPGDLPIVVNKALLVDELIEQFLRDRFLDGIRWEHAAHHIALVGRVGLGEVRRKQRHVAPGDYRLFRVVHHFANIVFSPATRFLERVNALGQAGDLRCRVADLDREKRLELCACLRPCEELIVGRLELDSAKNTPGGGHPDSACGGKAGQWLGDRAGWDFPLGRAGRQRLVIRHDCLGEKIIFPQPGREPDGVGFL